MTDVFISYKREDRERCAALAVALRQLDLSVWFDADIEPGTTFDREIERELKRAKAVLVLWSERSVDSDWVRNEARVGRAADKLVAVKIEECDLPLEFMASQVAVLGDLSANEDWCRVVGRVGRLVGRPGLLPFVEAQSAGRAEGWRDWLARYGADDPLAAKAQRYLAAMGAPVAPAAPVVPPPSLLNASSEPVVAASRSPLLLGGGVALIAALALAAYALSGGGEAPDAHTPSGLPSASPAVSATGVGAATPAPQTDAPADESVTEVEAPPPPAEVAQAAPVESAPATSCEAGPYVIAISADTSVNMAEGEATLGAAAAAYKAGCDGRLIRIRGVANGDAMPLMRRRAGAAASYLASQGLPRDRIEIVVDRARAQGERIVVTFGS